jgi:hypothetical protein
MSDIEAVVSTWTGHRSGSWSVFDGKGGKRGVALSFENGERCFETGDLRTSRIVFTCTDVAADVGKLSFEYGDNPCDYLFFIQAHQGMSYGGPGVCIYVCRDRETLCKRG